MLRIISLARSQQRTLAKTPCPCQSHATSLPHVLASPFSSLSQRKKGKEKEDAPSLFNRDPTSPPRLFLVQPRLRPARFLQAKLNEALCLANSLEEQREGHFNTDFFDKALPPHVVVQNPVRKSSKPRADTYFGPGTVDNVKCHLNVADSEEELDGVYVNAILTGIQQRNLERLWGKPVLDRVGLIIEIFNAHAHTKEAKLQAELAALIYKKSRLVRVHGPNGRQTFGTFGEAQVVSARGRGSGGRGFISGAGETELQLQRRRILERRNHLISQIEEVRRTRAVQRAARKRHGGLEGQGLPTVAVVGYTNAGKSTLISALSNTYLYSNERLFATLDPRLKSVILPSGRKVLLSDTVGFISDLPIQLVEAFRSTLEEVVEADFLLHVVDSTAPNLDEHCSTVYQVLYQIGVPEEKLQNMVEVWNKIDYKGEETEGLECDEDVEEEENSHQPPYNDSTDADVGQLIDGGIEVESKDDLDEESNEWLLTSDDEVDSMGYWNTVEEQSHDCSNVLEMVESRRRANSPYEPHAKVSALTGAGLKELLELIDERLQRQEEKKLESRRKVENNSMFERKWRPPRKEETDVGVDC